MGFEFRTEPTEQERFVMRLQDQVKQLGEQVAATTAKLEEVEQFIDENTLLQKFYAWQQIKEAIRQGQIVMNDGVQDVEFEEVKNNDN
jgi:hypothetical protein